MPQSSEMPAGSHRLRVTAVGKNNVSQGFAFGLDAVDRYRQRSENPIDDITNHRSAAATSDAPPVPDHGHTAGFALWQCDERAYSRVTGLVMPRLAAYDDLMTTFLREHKPPGAALAVIYHGRLVYARGFGHANLEKHEPVRPAALFRA